MFSAGEGGFGRFKIPTLKREDAPMGRVVMTSCEAHSIAQAYMMSPFNGIGYRIKSGMWVSGIVAWEWRVWRNHHGRGSAVSGSTFLTMM